MYKLVFICTFFTFLCTVSETIWHLFGAISITIHEIILLTLLAHTLLSLCASLVKSYIVILTSIFYEVVVLVTTRTFSIFIYLSATLWIYLTFPTITDVMSVWTFNTKQCWDGPLQAFLILNLTEIKIIQFISLHATPTKTTKTEILTTIINAIVVHQGKSMITLLTS